MRRSSLCSLVIVTVLFFAPAVAAAPAESDEALFPAQRTFTHAPSQSFDFAAWQPAADGVTDDGPRFKDFFADLKAAGGGQARIPPGTYLIEVAATNQAPIPSNAEIDATGAEFRFSRVVGHRIIFTWLYDSNVVNFIWRGGRFVGHAFDLSLVPHTLNTCHPQAHVRCFHIRTGSGGHTANILFDGVVTDGIQGAAISVAGKWLDFYNVDTYATNVILRRCEFRRTGPFLWDYGFLWQRLVWAHEYDDNHRSLAETYFDPGVPRASITRAEAGGTRLEFDNQKAEFPWTGAEVPPYYVWFYGTKVDSSLTRGRAYYAVACDAGHLAVSQTPAGPPIALAGDGRDMKVMWDLQRAYYTMLHPYPPVAGEAAHGAYMISAAVGVQATRCTVTQGNGDAMLIHTSRDVLLSRNQFYGARMGAVWIGDLCENVVVRGNYVDGGNGSRVLSVERSSKDVVVADNTFTNGGRGAWINQPRGILISNNVFIANNGKNTPDPYVGSRSWQNGGYDNYEPLYFTTHNVAPWAGQTWGPITIVSNVMDTGSNHVPPAMIHIHDRARDVIIAGNTFRGDARTFIIHSTVENVRFGYNAGILTTNWGRYDVVTTAPSTSQIRLPHELADNSNFLNVIPTVTPANPASAMAGVTATDTEIVANLKIPAPAGTRLEFDWTASLKWK